MLYKIALFFLIFASVACAQGSGSIIKIQDANALWTGLMNETALSVNQKVYFPKGINGRVFVVTDSFSSTVTYEAGDILMANGSGLNYMPRFPHGGDNTAFVCVPGNSDIPSWAGFSTIVSGSTVAVINNPDGTTINTHNTIQNSTANVALVLKEEATQTSAVLSWLRQDGGAAHDIINHSGVVRVSAGGTGLVSYTTGDIPYASGATTISKLGIGANKTILTSSGSAPQWSSSLTLDGGSLTIGNSTTPGAVTLYDNSNHYQVLGLSTQSANLVFNFPPTAGSSGYVLQTDGTGQTSWTAAGGSGTVTSVAVSGGTTGLTTSGGPITSSGTITLAGTLVVANGGTGTTTLTGVVHGNGTSAMTAANVNLASEVTGTLPYANGGTGATSYTTNGALYAGSSAFASTAAMTNGQVLVGSTSSNPVLTTITAGTNMSVTNGAGSISIACTLPGTAGATAQANTNTDPTGNSTEKMAGLAESFTPQGSGICLLMLSGTMSNALASTLTVQLRYGTGSAPAQGATLTGTTVGSKIQAAQSNSGQQYPFSLNAVVTGLTAGTVYWADVSSSSNTGGVTKLSLGVPSFSMVELPLSPTGTTAQSTPSDPTGNGNSAYKMMGLAGSITPSSSGRILLIISGDGQVGSSAAGGNIKLKYGTSTAPTNGATETGTTAGGILNYRNSAAAQVFPYSQQAVITGLTVGTAYWLDEALISSAGTASLKDISISAIEF